MIIFAAILQMHRNTPQESSFVKARSHLIINDEKCLLVYLLFILCERRNAEVLFGVCSLFQF
jgi:hypothetical protein